MWCQTISSKLQNMIIHIYFPVTWSSLLTTTNNILVEDWSQSTCVVCCWRCKCYTVNNIGRQRLNVNEIRTRYSSGVSAARPPPPIKGQHTGVDSGWHTGVCTTPVTPPVWRDWHCLPPGSPPCAPRGWLLLLSWRPSRHHNTTPDSRH